MSKSNKPKDENKAEFYQSGDTRHYTAPGTAVYIRMAFKKAFPGVTFKVKSSSYSVVHVDYWGGPSHDAVNAVLDPFNGAGFDGMIDYKYYKTAYLIPATGETGILESEGTMRTGGMEPRYIRELPAGAVKVRWADWVAASRHFTMEQCQEIKAAMIEKFGQSIGEFELETLEIKTGAGISGLATDYCYIVTYPAGIYFSLLDRFIDSYTFTPFRNAKE